VTTVKNIAISSMEMVPLPVTLISGCTCVDLTTFVVEMAFKLPGVQPAGADWHVAAWDTSCGDCRPIAQILVGAPAGVVLAVGTYVPWVRVTAPPEVVVEPSNDGFVRIY
jgi:hypothetical protein